MCGGNHELPRAAMRVPESVVGRYRGLGGSACVESLRMRLRARPGHDSAGDRGDALRTAAPRPNLQPRPCACHGADLQCRNNDCDSGMIKPRMNDTQYTFDKRQYCCRFCPVLHARQTRYRHTKKIPEIKEPTSVDLFLRGRL